MTRSQLPVLQRALSAHEATPTSRTAAHLADAPFRFGPPEHHAQPVPRPEGPGAHWTPAETLCELRLRGVKVVETTLGLRVRHAHRLPEVAAAVRAHADVVRLWLRLGRPAQPPDRDQRRDQLGSGRMVPEGHAGSPFKKSVAFGTTAARPYPINVI